MLPRNDLLAAPRMLETGSPGQTHVEVDLLEFKQQIKRISSSRSVGLAGHQGGKESRTQNQTLDIRQVITSIQ